MDDEKIKQIFKNDLRGYFIVSRLLNWLDEKKAPPYLLNFYYTRKCNLKCKFCHYGTPLEKIDHSDELTEEELLKITEDGCKFGIDWWYLAGGEPVYNPDIVTKMMKIIKKYNKHGNINTNGLLVNEKVSKIIVDIGWDEINFSINSPESKEDNYLRGKENTFETVVKNIKRLYQIKKENRSKTPLIGIHTVITNKIYNKITKMVELAHKLGAESLNFSHVMSDTNLVKDLRLDKRELEIFKREVKKAEKLAKKYRLYSNLSYFVDSLYNDEVGSFQNLLRKNVMKKDKKNLLSSVCFEPWLEISVFADGVVGPCGNWDPGRHTESLREKSFREIWYGTKFQKIREDFIKNKPDPLCQDCACSIIYRNEEIKQKLKKVLNV